MVQEKLPFVNNEFDGIAFETVLLDRAEALDRYVRRKLPRNVQRVISPEDVLQEVWTTAFRRMSSFRADRPDDLDRWLMKITESRVIDALRHARRLKRDNGRQLEQEAHRRTQSYLNLFAQVAGRHRTPSSEDAAKEAVSAVQVAVAGLPEECRSAVTLHHLHGQTRGEIASAMGKTEAAVNSLIYRGMQKLRESLGQAERFFPSEARRRNASGPSDDADPDDASTQQP